jgi:hypothetical protein
MCVCGCAGRAELVSADLVRADVVGRGAAAEAVAVDAPGAEGAVPAGDGGAVATEDGAAAGAAAVRDEGAAHDCLCGWPKVSEDELKMEWKKIGNGWNEGFIQPGTLVQL